MKRLLTPLIVTATLVIAACGSDDDDGTAPPAPAAEEQATRAPAEPAIASTVNVAEVDGFGPVLTDTEGQVLYTADEEANPEVLCTDACAEFWAPLEAGSESPTGAPGVTGLGVAARPDGSEQITIDGRRLYTFTLDSPGEVTGDGFSDTFGDQQFTWHAVTTEAAAASTGSGATPDTATNDDAGTVFDDPGY